MSGLKDLDFTNRFATLSNGFYAQVDPTPISQPELISVSQPAMKLMGLDASESQQDDFVAYFSGNKLFDSGNPIAMLYSGHQFGQYNPQLGDGRAIMLGEITTDTGEAWELQLKGSGVTPFSRSADGRAVLRSSIREYLCSEAMAALGIPTTRALCLIGSDEDVYREQIETAAMVLRMAPSHVRFGSFEIFYHRQEYKKLAELADFVIQNHYPEFADKPDKIAQWFDEIVKRTAQMISKWQQVGFAHGVMNTDNMSILGLTLDYGPFGFLDAYNPDFICNHSDHQGRYAFDQQPNIGLWNLTCLAQAILPLLNEDDPEDAVVQAQELLSRYNGYYTQDYAQGMCHKLGLQEIRASDQALLDDLLQKMQANQVDYTRLFRQLSQFERANPLRDHSIRHLFKQPEAFDQWAVDYRQRLASEQSIDAQRSRRMKQVNPKYILRNYLAQVAITQAEQGDFSEVNRLLTLLENPFDEQPEMEKYASLPPEWSHRISISCSS